MKKYLFILLLFSSLSALAQDSTKVYTTSVRLPVSDIQTFLQALEKWKALTPYEPGTGDREKVMTIVNIDSYRAELLKRIKIDSVLVVDSAKVQPKRKR